MSTNTDQIDNTPDEFDEFAPGSGLKSNFDGEVIDAFFAMDPQYNQGKTLVLKLKTKDLADGSEDENFYPCGTGWGSYDGGETAEHEKGEKHPFNRNSAVATLMAYAFLSGAEEELRARSKNEFNRMGTKAAGIWKGLRFHWEAVEETFRMKDRTSGEMVDLITTRVLPTSYLGNGATSGAASTATQSTASQTSSTSATSAASEPAPLSSDPLSLVSPETSSKMKVLAGAFDYHAWVDQVMSLPGVIDAGTVLITAIGDESFYNQLKG